MTKYQSKNLFKSIFFLVLCTTFLACKNSNIASPENIQDIKMDAENQENNVFDFHPGITKNQVVRHEFYSLSYSEEHEQAEWVAYFLDGKPSQAKFERPFFIEDPLVDSNSADWRNYRKSGFDKGHLCPAGDMKSSKKAFDDTFYTSNISPQRHDFNDGIWNRLEQKTRYWASKYNGIYVVTAGVLSDDLEHIGTENVAVPEYFYKVLLYKNGNNYKMIGFLVPHQDSDKPLYKFVVSVDEIEQKTGIDFYPKLEDVVENQLEKSANYKDWAF